MLTVDCDVEKIELLIELMNGEEIQHSCGVDTCISITNEIRYEKFTSIESDGETRIIRSDNIDEISIDASITEIRNEFDKRQPCVRPSIFLREIRDM